MVSAWLVVKRMLAIQNTWLEIDEIKWFICVCTQLNLLRIRILYSHSNSYFKGNFYATHNHDELDAVYYNCNASFASIDLNIKTIL